MDLLLLTDSPFKANRSKGGHSCSHEHGLRNAGHLCETNHVDSPEIRKFPKRSGASAGRGLLLARKARRFAARFAGGGGLCRC